MYSWMCEYNELSKVLSTTLQTKYTEIFYVDGKRCTTIENFYKEFFREVRFPDYFGWNHNAFTECMVDVDSYEAPALCIINNVNSIAESDKDSQDFYSMLLILLCIVQCEKDT